MLVAGTHLAVLKDPRCPRWDGHVTKVLPVLRLERQVAPGEIAVFTYTGEEEPIEEVTHVRGGERRKTVQARVYRRTSSRLVRAA